MPGADDAGRDPRLDRWREVEQAKGVADVRPGPAYLLRQLFMRGTKVIKELLIGGGLFQRVELLAVQVLHEGVTEHGVVMGFPHYRRDNLQARSLGSAPAPLTHDEFIIALTNLAHHDWLQQADFSNGRG
jgi:hypothetical protein